MRNLIALTVYITVGATMGILGHGVTTVGYWVILVSVLAMDISQSKK